MQHNHSTNIIFLQDTINGRHAPWEAKKMANTYLAQAYSNFDTSKSLRLQECGSFLAFKRFSDGTKKLHTMSSCHVRLCPLCTWRRSLKTYANNAKMIDYIESKKHYGYILLTLTMRNVSGQGLNAALNTLNYSFKKLTQTTAFKGAVKGYFKGIEVTHNVDYLSSDYDSYHPHIHCLLAVNQSYFTHRSYISHEMWTELWRKCLGVEYTPIVNVKRIKNITDSKGGASKAVAEVSKYSVKDSDYIIYDDWDLTVDSVEILDKALTGRRLCGYAGIFRQARKELDIIDEDKDDNLIEVGDGLNTPDGDFVLEFYFWHTGYREYIKGEKP